MFGMKSKNKIDHLDNTRVRLTTSIAYSLPQFTAVWLMAPTAIVQGIYAKHYGLALTTIAVVVLMARFFDAITDPIIGYCSDRHRARTGTRKPFIWVGGLVAIISSYFFYVPPEHVSTMYFTCWFLLFYLGWTIFEVPHLAWGSELAGESHERTKIYTVRSIAGYLGLLLFYTVPLLPFFETSEITPETLKWSVIAAGLVMLPMLYLCIKTVPDVDEKHFVNKKEDNTESSNKKQSFRLFQEVIIQNKPFLWFLVAYSFCSIGGGMWFGLIFIYVDTYLGLGDQFAGMFMLAFVAGVIATPVWYKLVIWLGRKTTWCIALAMVMLSFIYTGMLTPSTASFYDLLAFKVLNTLGASCILIVVPSMLADIVDYGTWKFGIHRAATYFSIYTFVVKASVSLGAGLGLAIAGWYGFDAAANTHSEGSVLALRLSISWLPALFMLVSLVLTMFIPITARHHEIILRRLEARAKRAEKKVVESASDLDDATPGIHVPAS